MPDHIDPKKETRAPWYYLLLLILAGEAVFILPFVLPRVFRPTVLDVFGVDNTELGLCFFSRRRPDAAACAAQRLILIQKCAPTANIC